MSGTDPVISSEIRVYPSPAIPIFPGNDLVSADITGFNIYMPSSQGEALMASGLCGKWNTFSQVTVEYGRVRREGDIPTQHRRDVDSLSYALAEVCRVSDHASQGVEMKVTITSQNPAGVILGFMAKRGADNRISCSALEGSALDLG